MALAQVDAMGWGPTQWVAALAVAGSLTGVWLGKTLEARYQRKLEETTEKRDQRRALEEALAQAEILYLRLDPGPRHVRAGLLPTEMQVAEQAETLLQQADQVQDLLVRSGIRNPTDPIRSVLGSLERSLHSAVQERLLFLAISFKEKEAGGTIETTESRERLLETLAETSGLLDQFRMLLGLAPISDVGPNSSEHPIGQLNRRTLNRRNRQISGRVRGPRNLLEFSPSEFRDLVAELLKRMGLEILESQQSPDRGADLIAVDPSPIAGGRIVVQIRQDLKPVSAETVRNLYGAVLHEGASKGLLVTTSTFSAASYKFAKDKPLELIDGLALIHLLSERAGIETTIP
jgi:restriction endonuclease